MSELIRGAYEAINSASILISAAQSDPGPAAGPRVVPATAILETASQFLLRAAEEGGQAAGELTRLSNEASARGREATAVAFIPWPFVYIGINGLRKAVVALRDAVGNFLPASALREPTSTKPAKLNGDDRASALKRLGLPEDFGARSFVVRFRPQQQEGLELEVRSSTQTPFSRREDAQAIADILRTSAIKAEVVSLVEER